MIEVRRTTKEGPFQFDVIVREAGGESHHHVTMSTHDFEKLAAGRYTPEHCLDAAFRFLLDREPRESILGRFDLSVISQYFPEFERELPRYLARSAD